MCPCPESLLSLSTAHILYLLIPQLPPFSMVSGEGAVHTIGCPGTPLMEQVLADEGGSPLTLSPVRLLLVALAVLLQYLP